MTVAHFLYSGLDPDNYIHGIATEPYLSVEFGYGKYPVKEEAVGDAEDNHEGDRPEQEKEVNNNDKTQAYENLLVKEVDLSQLRKGCSSEAHTAKLADDFKDNSQSKNKVAVTAKKRPPVIDLTKSKFHIMISKRRNTSARIIRRVWADDPTIQNIATPFGSVSAYSMRTLMPGRELVAEMIDRYMELLQNTPRPADAARIGTVTVDFLVRYQHQIFTAQFARHASTSANDAVMSFTQQDIPRLRREMAEEIITGQLSWQPVPAVVNNLERVRPPLSNVDGVVE
uniref:Uncharacterized protein n=1 Tax=Ditylenchus dipsaci TaxID=166011 RepID=A0A915DYV7_9BILA